MSKSAGNTTKAQKQICRECFYFKRCDDFEYALLDGRCKRAHRSMFNGVKFGETCEYWRVREMTEFEKIKQTGRF